jgi:hypothetical protein
MGMEGSGPSWVRGSLHRAFDKSGVPLASPRWVVQQRSSQVPGAQKANEALVTQRPSQVPQPQTEEAVEAENIDVFGGLGTGDASTDVVPDVADEGREPRDGSAEQGPGPGRESGEQVGENTEPGNEQRQDEYDRAGAEHDGDRLNGRLDKVSGKLDELRGKSTIWTRAWMKSSRI